VCLPRLSAPKLRRVGGLLRQQGAAADNAVELWLAGRLSVLDSLTYGSVSPFSCVMRCLHPRTCVARRGQGGSWHGQGRCLLTTMLWLWQAQGARSPPCPGSGQPAGQFRADWACVLCQAVSTGAAGAPSSSDAGSKRGSPRSPDASGGSPGGAAGALRALFGRRLSGERGSLKRSASNGQMQPVCPSLLHGEAGLTEGEHMGTVYCVAANADGATACACMSTRLEEVWSREAAGSSS
jgi:hypothetical protein